MTGLHSIQVLLYFIVLLFLVKPLGTYIYRVYEDRAPYLERFLSPLENFIYRIVGISSEREMNWKTYLFALLIFNIFGVIFLYLLQRIQFFLPLNPEHFTAVKPDLAFNTATSFVTNTNWQAYSGENTLSYLTQMLGMTVQNFLSPASGLVLLMAVTRGLVRAETSNLGNFWIDIVRTVLYILLPLACVFAILLSACGVIQNFKNYQTVDLLEPITYQQVENNKLQTHVINQQTIPMGPVASQVAIKQLGTNGGGFFGTNSAHPFENPTSISNFLECLAILLIPMASCYTFGLMVKDRRQGWALFISMIVILLPIVLWGIYNEQKAIPAFEKMNIQQQPINYMTTGGNLEGKEIRFGILSSTLWTIVTTATSNGSANSAIDSAAPLTKFLAVWLMNLEEVIFGGVGSGIYGMLLFVFIAVFLTGLLVGRTPEYLGKKIEPYEMKMAMFAILIVPFLVLVFSAVTMMIRMGADTGNPGPEGFTEILYAFSSMVNNNGSALGGLSANQPFFNILGGVGMLIGRYWIAIPILAIAGSLARKKMLPIGPGTLPTSGLLFIGILVGVVLVMGALTFLPALALGPIVEHLMVGNI